MCVDVRGVCCVWLCGGRGRGQAPHQQRLHSPPAASAPHTPTQPNATNAPHINTQQPHLNPQPTTPPTPQSTRIHSNTSRTSTPSPTRAHPGKQGLLYNSPPPSPIPVTPLSPSLNPITNHPNANLPGPPPQGVNPQLWELLTKATNSQGLFPDDVLKFMAELNGLEETRMVIQQLTVGTTTSNHAFHEPPGSG